MARASDESKPQPNSPQGDLLLVVDAGGTKTAAWLVDATRCEADRILGRGHSTAGNPLSVGFAKSTRAVAEAAAYALDDARRTNLRVSRAILSVAGAANREMNEQFVRWAREAALAEHVAIVSDVLPVLAAGTPNCCGVALIAGTGSVAFGRAGDGRTALCGGWGYLLGDEGSGFAIGRAGLHLALHHLETKASPQPLVDIIISALGAETVTELTNAIYNNSDSRRAIAALTPLLIEAADRGDADAQAILDTAAQDLAKLVARAAHLIGPSERPFSLAVGGGVLVGSKRLRDQLQAELRRIGMACEMNVVDEPLEGCIRLVDAEFAGNLVSWHKI